MIVNNNRNDRNNEGPGGLEQGNNIRNVPGILMLRQPAHEMVTHRSHSSGDPTPGETETPSSNGTNAKDWDPLLKLSADSRVADNRYILTNHLLCDGITKLSQQIRSPETQGLSRKTTREDATTEDEETGQTLQRTGTGHISFAPQTHPAPSSNKALRVPGPRDFERGELINGGQVGHINDLARL